MDVDVVNFGAMYPCHAKMMCELANLGLTVTVFGTNDKCFPKEEITKNFRSEFIIEDRKSEVLRDSTVVFNNFQYVQINSSNVKYFEIAGIGGFQICDYKPVLEEYSEMDVKDYAYKFLSESVELVSIPYRKRNCATKWGRNRWNISTKIILINTECRKF